MSVEQLSRLIEDSNAVAAKADAASPHAQLLDLARKTSTRLSFLKKSLEIIAASFNSPFAAIYLRLGSETFEDEVRRGSTDPAFWRGTVQQFLTDSLAGGAPRARLLSARSAQLTIGLLCAPLYDAREGKPGAIAMVVRCTDDDLREHLARLESLSALVSHLVVVQGERRGDDAAARVPSSSLGRAASYESPTELAFSLTNGLRSKLGCEQVTLGLAGGKHIRLLSISGLDDVRHRSPGVIRIREAMEECLDHGDVIVCQGDDAAGDERLSSGHRLHKQWRDSIGGASVASIPLSEGERVTAVITMRRRHDEMFTKEQLAQIKATVEPFAPAFRLLREARRGVLTHCCDSVRAFAASLFQPGRIGRKVCCGVAALAALWLAFGTMQFSVTLPAKVVPADSRHVSCATDARLLRVDVQPGDRVAKGQVLCEFDSGELQLQQRASSAQAAVLDSERARAMAADSPADARIAETNLTLEQARLSIIEQRIRDCVVRAPCDGVIVSGDLRKRVGGPIQRGEPLFEIAGGGWRLELETPQDASAHVIVGLKGRFASHARPELTQPFTVESMRPAAELRRRETVYVADASVCADADWIRPGMEGLARVECGVQPTWWVCFHHGIDFLRLHWWL